MSKLRVNDLAAEFGIAGDEVVHLLRALDIPFRSHISTLTDDQVARVRARWEREKRAKSAPPPPPPTGASRRRKAAVEPEKAAEPVVRRRRAASVEDGSDDAVHGSDESDTTPTKVAPVESAPVEASAQASKNDAKAESPKKPTPLSKESSEKTESAPAVQSVAAMEDGVQSVKDIPVASETVPSPQSSKESQPTSAAADSAPSKGSTETVAAKPSKVDAARPAPVRPTPVKPAPVAAPPAPVKPPVAEAAKGETKAKPAPETPAKAPPQEAAATPSAPASPAAAKPSPVAPPTPAAPKPVASSGTPGVVPPKPDFKPLPPRQGVPPSIKPAASSHPRDGGNNQNRPHQGNRPQQQGGRPTPIQHAQPRASASPPTPVRSGPPRARPTGGQGGGGQHRGPRPIASAAPGGQGAGPGRDQNRNQGHHQPPAGAGGGAPSRGSGGRDRDRGGRRGSGRRVDQEAVSANIFKTMSSMRGGSSRKGGSRRDDTVSREEIEVQRKAAVERERKTVRVNEFVTVSELAQQLKVPATQIVGFAFKNLGLMVTINQRLDFDQIELIAGEFGFQAVREDEYLADTESLTEVDAPESLESRPPVVTIMGHVDHGKTSLLDYIRKATVVAGEAGGITQHIGAYHVTLPSGSKITFLDTPGHEAFTAMRARGAQVTDIVVLVVAADDQVMPQTIEAISHAKNAGVPIIVAINKIDLPAANALKVKQDLLQHEVVLEEFGGTTLSTEISAKTGQNVQSLLEQIVLQSEILDLKANPNRMAVGTVIEAQLDPGKGPVATVLIQNGTLKVGNDFICGLYSGRVRALLDERGKQQKEAGPAIPVQILGISGVPMAGDQLFAVEDASASRDIAQRRQRLDREAKSRRTSKGSVSLEDFMSQAAAGEQRSLRIVIKADQGGPAEALADALGQLSTEEVAVEVIHRGVGAISESDILLARASGAIIIGFHVRPDNNARNAAEREGVDIRLYRIIYEAVEDVKRALEGLLRPEEREVVLGEAEVRETFKVSRIGVIAGCWVRNGVINRQGRVRVIRDGVEIYDGTIGSLKRFKDDAKEVREGFECGIGVDNFNDIKVGDIIECYSKEQIARTLPTGS